MAGDQEPSSAAPEPSWPAGEAPWRLTAPIPAEPAPSAPMPSATPPGAEEGAPAADPEGLETLPVAPAAPNAADDAAALEGPADEPPESVPRVRRYRSGVETAPDDLLHVPGATAQAADEFFEDLARHARDR